MPSRRQFIQTAAGLPALMALEPAWAAPDPARVALVVGNSAYAQAPLENPANDAAAMRDLLGAAGFTLESQLNAKRADLLAAIDRFTQQIDRSETRLALFYYAGHGAQLDWRNYLLPVDINVRSPEDMKTQCVELGTLLSRLTKYKDKTFIIVLDACRDDPFRGSYRPQQKGLSQFDAPVGSLLAYATSPGNVASDGSGKNGLYTENLVRELAVREARIEDALKRVRLQVRLASQGEQIPWETTSLERDVFIFKDAQKKLTEAEVERLAEADIERWGKIKSSRNTDDWIAYLRDFPNGRFAEIAQARLARMLADVENKRLQKQRDEEAQAAREAAAKRERERQEKERLRLAEEQRQEAERQRLEAARRAEEARLENERRALAEAERQAAERRRQEDERMAAERLRLERDAAQKREQVKKAEDEKKRLADAQRLDQQRLELERQRRAEEQRIATEKQRLEEQRLALEKARREEAEALAQQQREEAELRERDQRAIAELEEAANKDRPPTGVATAAASPSSVAADMAKDAPALIIDASHPAPMLIAPSANPYSAGRYPLGRIYTVGDSITMAISDTLTGLTEKVQTLNITKVDYDQFRGEANDGKIVFDLMGNAIKLGDIEYDTPVQFHPAELYIGKKWTAAFIMSRGDGKSNAYYDVTIAARETIDVPAGRFDCFRIEGDGWNTTYGSKLQVKIWLVPGLIATVRREFFVTAKNGRIIRSDRHELVAVTQHRSESGCIGQGGGLTRNLSIGKKAKGGCAA